MNLGRGVQYNNRNDISTFCDKNRPCGKNVMIGIIRILEAEALLGVIEIEMIEEILGIERGHMTETEIEIIEDLIEIGKIQK